MSSEEYKNGNYSYASFLVDRNSNYQIKKYADKLKDIVCLLIGCKREQLEDREFKEKELGEEWWYYDGHQFGANKLIPYNHKGSPISDKFLIKLTPRKLLQLLGTECGRQIIHPQIWVNALFADYKGIDNPLEKGHPKEWGKPNWIITDVRFPNEAEAIKQRGGIVIRVNRYCYDSLEDYLVTHPNKNVSAKAVKIVSDWGLNKHGVMEEKLKEIPESKGYYEKSNHPSETALDDYKFDYVIDNNGSISELIEKVKQLNLV